MSIESKEQLEQLKDLLYAAMDKAQTLTYESERAWEKVTEIEGVMQELRRRTKDETA